MMRGALMDTCYAPFAIYRRRFDIFSYDIAAYATAFASGDTRLRLPILLRHAVDCHAA